MRGLDGEEEKSHSKQREWGIQKLSGIRKAQDFLGPAEFVVYVTLQFSTEEGSG